MKDKCATPRNCTGAEFDAVAAGGDHSVALKSDGSLSSCGRYCERPVPHTPSGPEIGVIVTKCIHCLAPKSEGSLIDWGGHHKVQVRPNPNLDSHYEMLS